MTLQDRMIECGFAPQDLPPVGVVRRFNAPGKSISNKSAWIMALDNMAAAFGDWATGAKYIWSADFGREMSAQEKESVQIAIEQARKKAEAERIVKSTSAAEMAYDIWHSSSEVIRHEYLNRKRVQAYNIKQSGKALVIPILNSNIDIVSIQSILPDGFKKFLPGGQIKGCFSILQIGTDTRTVIAEGYATAASIAEFYYPESTIVSAFNAGNLLPVAKTLKTLVPNNQIIIAGDNDKEAKVNVGKEKAIYAAQAVDGIVDLPEFFEGETGTDWNDRASIDFAHLWEDAA